MDNGLQPCQDGAGKAKMDLRESLRLDAEEWAEILALFVETTLADLDDLLRAIQKWVRPVQKVARKFTSRGQKHGQCCLQI